ncbi:MAG: hypothetical protein QW184_01075 [Nanopusillaceae archaeon]
MDFKAYIEALGNDKDTLKKFLEEISKKIKEFKSINIKNIKIEEPIEREIEESGKKMKLWSSYIEILASIEKFEDLIDFVLWYSPSKIEVLDLKEIKILTSEKEIRLGKENLNILLNQISSRIIEMTRLVNILMTTNSILYKTLEKYAPGEIKKLQDNQPK